jgi:hypothetical protein
MHLLRRFSLSRRTMLRGLCGGAVVSLGLPPLEAMFNANGDALAGGEPLPRKFITWMAGNGFLLSRLEPENTGTNWELTEQLMPLADMKSYVNVCTGFQSYGQVDSFLLGHIEGITGYSGYQYTMDGFGGYYNAGGPTIDQVIADKIAETTTTSVRSLQVGISKAVLVGACNIYTTLSFRGSPGNITPLPPTFDPGEVWQTLFGIYPGPHAPEDDRAIRKSMVDIVKGQAEQLKPKLGVLDSQRIDAHLQGIAELESKISTLPPPCALPAEPTLHNNEPVGSEKITDVMNLMSELIAYALNCDITRVASIMLLAPAGETPWTEAGVSATHHTLSHNAQTIPTDLESYNTGIVYQMERLASFCQKLKDTVDPMGGNLLDSTIVYASSDLSVGWLHSINRLPVMLIGSGGGHLKTPGIHVQATENNESDPDGYNTPYMPADRNVSDILLSCLLAFDPDADSIGGGPAMSQDPCTEVLA